MRPAVALAFLLALSACTNGADEATLGIRTDSGQVTVRVEVAETSEDRARGLMHRTELADDAGMVFLFDEPTDGGFWMKDTLIPLSIAFWDRDGVIAAIMEMEPCRADPCPRYRPGVTYMGAVEVNRGFFEDHSIEVGDRVELER